MMVWRAVLDLTAEHIDALKEADDGAGLFLLKDLTALVRARFSEEVRVGGLFAQTGREMEWRAIYEQIMYKGKIRPFRTGGVLSEPEFVKWTETLRPAGLVGFASVPGGHNAILYASHPTTL